MTAGLAPCPECLERGDLRLDGRPYQHRLRSVKACGTCGGTGTVREPFVAINLRPRTLKDVAYALRRSKRAQLEHGRFDEDPDPELVALVEEPAGGENFGRQDDRPLETSSSPSLKDPLHPRIHESDRAHGTRARYRKHGCRCAECRAWEARRKARQREA